MVFFNKIYKSNILLSYWVIIIISDVISNRYKAIGELISSKRLKRIDVITKSGEILGKVKEVRINGFNVEGILVYKPFSFNSEFIDKNFIKVFNKNEVLLNTNPVTALKGLLVYDNSGRKLGKVKKVLRKDNKNDFKSLIVKDKFYSRPILVEKDKISIMKKNIVLNIDYVEYSDNLKKNEKK